MFCITLVACELFDVKFKALNLGYTFLSLCFLILKLLVVLSFIELCALALVKSVVQTLARHTVVAKLIHTLVVRAFHVKAPAIFLDRRLALRAWFGKQLDPFITLVFIATPVFRPS